MSLLSLDFFTGLKLTYYIFLIGLNYVVRERSSLTQHSKMTDPTTSPEDHWKASSSYYFSYYLK